jgi:hypothetical protein
MQPRPLRLYPAPGQILTFGGCGKKKKEKKEKKKEKKEKRRFSHLKLGFETISFLGVFWG